MVCRSNCVPLAWTSATMSRRATRWRRAVVKAVDGVNDGVSAARAGVSDLGLQRWDGDGGSVDGVVASRMDPRVAPSLRTVASRRRSSSSATYRATWHSSAALTGGYHRAFAGASAVVVSVILALIILRPNEDVAEPADVLAAESEGPP